jgi:hypothetical protein
LNVTQVKVREKKKIGEVYKCSPADLSTNPSWNEELEMYFPYILLSSPEHRDLTGFSIDNSTVEIEIISSKNVVGSLSVPLNEITMKKLSIISFNKSDCVLDTA